MLFIGEKVGRGTTSAAPVDLALDPLEGTTLCAFGKPGAISVVALAARGCLLNAPDVYMDKLCVGPRARGAIDLRRSPTENLTAVARALGRSLSELTVMIQERARHHGLVDEVRRAGARVRLIEEGDVAGCVSTCFEASGVDVLMGTGGAPEGVIAAAAMRCTGGDFQGRLVFPDDAERARAYAMGVTDPDRVYKAEELARGDVMFAATGVTSSDFLKGVRFFARGAETSSIIMRSKTGTVRFVTALHDFEKKPM
jgi:fructose-1,6-bisphosphatase II